MGRVSAKDRQDALMERTQQTVDDRNTGSRFGQSVINTSEFEDVPWFRPKAKKSYEIDLLPWEVTEEKYHGKVQPGFLDYVLDVWVHRSIGPREDDFICLKSTLGKACPICEAIQGMSDEEKEGLTPSRRSFFNIIDLNDEDKGVQIFATSHFLFTQEMLEKISVGDENIAPAHLEKGHTIKFRTAEGKYEKRSFVKFKDFSFEERDPYNDDILDECFPFDKMLVIPTYEEVQNSFLGTEDEGGKDEPREERQTRSGRSRRSTRDSREERAGEKPEGKEGHISECPHDHEFGKDCDEYEEDCASCDVWNECANAGSEPEGKKEEEKESRGRSRRGGRKEKDKEDEGKGGRARRTRTTRTRR